MKYQAPQFPDMSVLLAEPNAFTMKLLRDLCRECGIYQAFEVGSALEMAAAIAANPVDILVIDQRIMQDREASGWPIIDARISPDGVAPVVMLFGLPLKGEIARAGQHGVRLALRKPFSPRDFWSRMEWLAGRAQPRLLEAAARVVQSPQATASAQLML